MKHFHSSFFKFKINLLVKRFFLLLMNFHHDNATFKVTCTYCFTYCHSSKRGEIFHVFHLFLIYRNFYWGRYPEIHNTIVFSTSISNPHHFPVSVSLSIMICSTVSFTASSAKSSAYLTLRITCPPILKSPNPLRIRLISYSLYKSNKISDKLHPCLIRFHSAQFSSPLGPVMF
jgi:hypothetical protein